jgi:glycerate 2-kinase
VFERQRRRVSEFPPQEIRCRYWPLDLVRPQAHALTRSTEPLRSDLLAIVQAAIRAADPRELTARALAGEAEWLDQMAVSVIAVGKASAAMADAASSLLGRRIRTGLVIGPTTVSPPPGFEVIVGEHPQPGPGSLLAGQRALAIARAVGASERLLVLLSGGASSLMAVPAEGIALEEKRLATAVLLRSGADIYALNTVRKHMSAIKGGQLASAAAGDCRTLVVSDVVGDDLSFIGSGPTVADASTFADARRVIDTFGGANAYPASVVAYLDAGRRGARPETPKPGDPRLARSRASVIGGRSNAMRGAADAARASGYAVAVLEEPVVGEAHLVARPQVERMMARAQSLPRPACVISSGETTVTVTGSGRGGRNQELALAAVETLGAATAPVAFASAGTDGVDGPTDAAGAIVDSSTLHRAADANLAISAYLHNNDSYSFFDRLGDLIRTGPTGTNVDDLQVLLLSEA